MSELADRLTNFIAYHAQLRGDEKGEAQVFLDRLFQAFGHAGYKEAGAVLEDRVRRPTGTTGFVDLLWKPRALIEMKKRGEKLQAHYSQAFDYWVNAVPDRPRYVVLCNFDEFWIYDFDRQLHDPVDQIAIADLPRRHTAFNFMLPQERPALFGNDREVVSRRAASQMGELFKLLIGHRRGGRLDRTSAQRFVLQLLVAMFAEDIDLLPRGSITSLARECLDGGDSSYDLLGGLFRQMNDPRPATGGRFVDVPYFNGGLFATIEPIELSTFELELIGGNPIDERRGVAEEDWSKINPAIFGTLFQSTMEGKEQHRHGRHFTSEADIYRVIRPTILDPWRARIEGAGTCEELLALRNEMGRYRVLDPACGSGNFLYVAFRELTRLEIMLLHRVRDLGGASAFSDATQVPTCINPDQFFGIDNDAFGVELAKVTLMLAKKLALDDVVRDLGDYDAEFAARARARHFADSALPLDNLDENIVLADALFVPWPTCEAIVGNPPYQSKNKLQKELGAAYLNTLRTAYPDIDGRSDYCVYWFRRAHDHLRPDQRAGLVATNTVRQNYSRVSGLDYILANGGTITEAVSNMVWPGAAAVHVSIVNWIKGSQHGLKRLYSQEGENIDEGWRHVDLPRIPSSLSFKTDVTSAMTLAANVRAGCFQGQTHGHKGFLWKAAEAKALLRADPALFAVLKPFLTADELFGQIGGKPRRYVVDFTGLDVLEAGRFAKPFKRLKEEVLPARQAAANEEADRNRALASVKPEARGNQHHANFLRQWWRMSYPREEMLHAIRVLPRYIVCGQVTKRPIFEFISNAINPNAALVVFAYADDYSFGILQSSIHWAWFVERCSTLKSDFRYTSNTVWDTFPWPQAPSKKQVRAVADKAVALRTKRHELCLRHGWPLRELYRTLDAPGDHPLKPFIDALDLAVRDAYGMGQDEDVLTHLLALNKALADVEAAGDEIVGPGLPFMLGDPTAYITDDAISP